MLENENLDIFCPYLDKLPIKNDILEIIRTSIYKVDPYNAVINSIYFKNNSIQLVESDIGLDEIEDIFLIGIGKASQKMSLAVCDVLGEKLSSGFVITKHISNNIKQELPSNVRIRKGNHPIPGEESLSSAKEILNFAKGMTKNDLVLCLISGGGSALVTLPETGISLLDYQKITNLLLGCGAKIQEINTIRRTIDSLKGGGLARNLFPAKVISLILSDVVGDPLDMIASGPTIKGKPNFEEVNSILIKYNLQKKIPESIQQFIQNMMDEPNEDNKEFSGGRIKNYLIANNRIAANAAVEKANEMGFKTNLITSKLSGEARKKGKEAARIIRQIKQNNDYRNEKFCYLIGGETTVSLSEKRGKGGRNQEYVLAAIEQISGLKDVCLISFATDGEDGPTDAAGAIVDGEMYNLGLIKGLDPNQYLANNNSYDYLDQLGALIKTGPTGTNVNDLVFLIGY